MKETATPNETAKELENQRRESIKRAVQGKNNQEEKIDTEKESGQEKNNKKIEKKLDNEQNNSYIDTSDKIDENKDSKEKSVDDQLEEYEKVLNETFGGDPRKAVKSWKESQKNFTKLRQQSKQAEQKIQALDTLLENNPKVEEILSIALEKGKVTDQDLQNFLQGGREPADGQINNPSSESKLEIVDNSLDIDENLLAKQGLLDLSKKELLSSSEWEFQRNQAALTYAQRNLPKRIASEAYKALKQQIDLEKENQEQQTEAQKNQRLNSERYQQGIEKVVDNFNLDFAGNPEHEALLDEIERLAANIRDPKNNRVIHQNAIYLATVEILNEKGISPISVKSSEEAKKAKQEAENALEDKIGFNKSGVSASQQTEPKTLADKLRQRHLSKYNKTLGQRKDPVVRKS